MSSVGKTVKYTDKCGNTITAKIVKSDGWSFQLDNGGILRALPKFIVN